MKKIIGGLLEELETTAGSVVKQAGQAATGVVSDAGKQIAGKADQGQQMSKQSLSPWEQIVGKPMDPKKQQKLMMTDEQKKQQSLNEVRKNLQELLQPPPEKQETPKYIKAKVEKQQEMQELQKKQKGKPPPLSVRSAIGQSGMETHGGWGVGG